VLHLRAAKALGDELIVAVTADAYVNKGPGRPVFNTDIRADMLRELRCVDRVIVVESGPGAVYAVRPDIFVKGKEYESNRIPEETIVRQYGGRVVYLDTPKLSSTALLRHYLDLAQGVKVVESASGR
jgi:cytidyltransferase-like protein